MTKIRNLLEVVAFWMLLLLARVLPRRVLLALGSVAGQLGYFVDRRHRQIAIENLSAAFGAELVPARARRITRACWRHFGRITFDTMTFRWSSREEIERRVVCDGREHALAAAANGNGVLFFTGHFGHWELAAYLQAGIDLPLMVVARPLDNPYLERMLARLRGATGNSIIHKKSAMREMLRGLRSGKGVAIVIDQDARRSGVFVPFFGRAASTTPSLALLALRTGAPVVPVFCVPSGAGTYRLVVEPEVEVHATDDFDADVLRLTAELTGIIEKWVRRHPEYWLWMHRRWKTRPPERIAERPTTPGHTEN